MLTLNAYAKINLTLDILGTREDGYHEVAMIMQSIKLSDTVELEKLNSGIKFVLDDTNYIGSELIPADETNLAYRAAKAFMEHCGLKSGVFIRLTKKIPATAGLAGGSADAAAVIRGMNKIFNLRLPIEELCEIGAEIGSDVPFCIVGGTCLATGRGEQLKYLPDLPIMPIVLVKPRGIIPTGWAYKTYDANPSPEHPNTNEIQEAIMLGDYEAVTELLFNVLERVAVKKYPVITLYKEKMIEVGAIAALMSGSGPTVFGIAKTHDNAKEIAAAFDNSGAQVFITETIGRF